MTGVAEGSPRAGVSRVAAKEGRTGATLEAVGDLRLTPATIQQRSACSVPPVAALLVSSAVGERC